MVSQPFNDAELQVALRLQIKIDKAAGRKPAAGTRFRPETSRLVLNPSEHRVELAAQNFYSQFGKCFYTENMLIGSVLGLFIWDIIFYPLPGVFYNPFQWAPADYHEPMFRTRRADLLADRFNELDDKLAFSARVMNGLEKHVGKSNPLVRWGRSMRNWCPLLCSIFRQVIGVVCSTGCCRICVTIARAFQI